MSRPFRDVVIMFAFAKKRMSVCHENRRRQDGKSRSTAGLRRRENFRKKTLTGKNSQEEKCTKKSFEDRCLFPLCCRSGSRRILCRAAADVKRFLLGGRMTIDSRTFKIPVYFCRNSSARGVLQVMIEILRSVYGFGVNIEIFF